MLQDYSKEAIAIALIFGLISLIILKLRRPEGAKIAKQHPLEDLSKSDIIQEKRELEREKNEEIFNQPSPDVDDVNAELERLRRGQELRRDLDSK